MVWTLEGGYDLNALGAGVVATLRVLLGDDTVDDPLGPFHGIPVSATDIIRLVKRLHAL
jgi:acetoin utilization deacetylase AcuC-like enzyme